MTNAEKEVNNPFRDLNRAQGLQVAGRWQESADAYVTFLEQIGGAEVTALNGRGVALRMLRRNFKAIADFTKARGLAAALSNQEAELTAVAGLIDAWRTADRDTTFPYPDSISDPYARTQYLYQQAESFIPDAQNLINQMPTTASLAIVNAYINFGLLHDNMGNPQEALGYYVQAESVIRELVASSPDNPEFKNRLARTLTTKGVAQEGVGDLIGAESSQREALSIYLDLRDLRGIGNSTISLGDVLKKLGRDDEARALWEQAREGAQRDGEIVDRDIYNLAEARLAQL